VGKDHQGLGLYANLIEIANARDHQYRLAHFGRAPDRFVDRV
jgi:hypothetical protein